MLDSKIKSQTSYNSVTKNNIFVISKQKAEKAPPLIEKDHFMDLEKMKDIIKDTPFAEKFELIKSIKEGSAEQYIQLN